VRARLAAVFLIWFASLVPTHSFAAARVIKLRALPPSDTHPTPEAIASGSLDDQFQPFSKAPGHTYWRDYWLRVSPQDPPSIDGIPVVIMNMTRALHADLIAHRDGKVVALPLATKLSGFLGTNDQIYLLPEGISAAQPFYAHVTSNSGQQQFLSFSVSALEATLTQGAEPMRQRRLPSRSAFSSAWPTCACVVSAARSA
jgi:hypothetical protein